MAYQFVQRRKVAFSETDLAGIVHFACFFPYMEDCEHAFYRSLNESVHKMDDGAGGWVGWPRIHASCDYRNPLRFEDEVDIEMLVADVGNKTIEYRFRFLKIGAEEPVVAAVGKVTVICVRFSEGVMGAVEIPEFIRKKIDSAPAEVVDSFAD